MKRFSIIIPTINRKEKLNKLLESIVNQNYSDLEIIVVNQNQNIEIDEIINKYTEKLEIKHYKVNFEGAAKARNYGFAKATGEIINFPDDDSVLVKDILKYVDNYFKENIIDVLFGKVKDLDSNKDILHFKRNDCKVRLYNIYQTTIETCMFIKKDVFGEIGMYDECQGIGTYFGAEEGADLVCRLLYKKYYLYYVAKEFFYHPNKKDETLFERSYQYSIGFGGFVYKHIKKYGKIYPVIYYLLMKSFKNIVCIIIGTFTLNKTKIKYNYYSLKGKIKGIKEKGKNI